MTLLLLFALGIFMGSVLLKVKNYLGLALALTILVYLTKIIQQILDKDFIKYFSIMQITDMFEFTYINLVYGLFIIFILVFTAVKLFNKKDIVS